MADFPPPGSRARGLPGLSRRSLISVGAIGLTGLLASGCSVDNPISEDQAAKPSTELAPDVAVATSALAEIRVLSTAVTATIARFPATRSQLTALVAMHRAHEASLVDAVPDRAVPSGSSGTPAPYAVARRRDPAVANLRQREQQLHDRLDELALRAESGDFARLLASMGAAVGQRVAGWPT